jgi:NADPH:quinone reductase-like Zn-dependent oxidoreductase
MDHTKQDFTQSGKRFDLILDLIARRSAFAYARVLNPGGAYLFVGGAVPTLLQLLLLGPMIGKATGKHIRLLAVPQNRKDLLAVTELVEAGKIRPVIDRQYPLEQVPEALRYVSAGRAKGKVVITVM